MIGRVFVGAFASLLAMAGIARADVRQEIRGAFDRCEAFADDRTWLNCIYGAVQPMRSKLGLPPAPETQTTLVPRAMVGSQPSLPASSPPQPVAKRVSRKPGGLLGFFSGGQSVEDRVAMQSYSIDQEGLFTITLENGDVWREIEGSPKAHWHGAASRYLVSVSTGTMESYNLEVSGEGIQYKAKRIR